MLSSIWLYLAKYCVPPHLANVKGSLIGYRLLVHTA
jgi:hypothetical protein